MTDSSYTSDVPSLIPMGISRFLINNKKVYIQNYVPKQEDITDIPMGRALNMIVQSISPWTFEINEKELQHEQVTFRSDIKLKTLNHSEYLNYIHMHYPNMYRWMKAVSYIDDILRECASDQQLQACWYLRSPLIDLLLMIRPTKWSDNSLLFGKNYFCKFVNSFYIIFDYIYASYDDAQIKRVFPQPLAMFILSRDLLNSYYTQFLNCVIREVNVRDIVTWTVIDVKDCITRIDNSPNLGRHYLSSNDYDYAIYMDFDSIQGWDDKMNHNIRYKYQIGDVML